MKEVAGLLVETGKILAPSIGRQFKYVYKYNTDFKNLQTEFENLKRAKDKVDVQVLNVEKNVELDIKDDVKEWQRKASITIHEAEKFIQQKANNLPCLEGFCLYLISRYKTGRKAFKLQREHLNLLKQQNEFRVVYESIYEEEPWLKSRDEILFLESRKSTLENVWEALNDANFYMIGVCGIDDDGKTDVVKRARFKASENNLFDEIVFIEVTETTVIEDIQREIAKQLNLEFKEESEKASQIYARLNIGKRILLILNNITRYIDLKTLRIPSEADRGGCKLLLTARNVDALKQMGSTKNFQIRFSNQQALDFHFFLYFSLVFTIFAVCFIVFALPFLQRKFRSF